MLYQQLMVGHLNFVLQSNLKHLIDQSSLINEFGLYDENRHVEENNFFSHHITVDDALDV
jgi:hypothetical protein